MARKPEGMNAEDIRAAIRKRYGTMSALSRKLGLHQNTVSTVISQPGHSAKVEQAIADTLGVSARDIWPDRYHDDGTPLSTRMARINTSRASSGLRANGAAA